MKLSLLFALALTLPVGPLGAADASKQAPEWAQSAIWYQIFPERFRNGDPTNDPTRESLEWPVTPSEKWRISPWTGDWYARDEWETEQDKRGDQDPSPDFYKHGVFDRRYGGDLQGVIDKLGYLKELGINAIYFNPVFYSRSMHKYDGNSYHHVDPYFGPDPQGDFALMAKETSDPKTWNWTAADKLFLSLVKEAHAKGMRVIIDGVWNHTGRDFFAFRDIMQRQDASPYKDWYKVESFDDPGTMRNEFDYGGWWGHKTLPVFAATPDGKDIHPGPKAYIWDSTRRWMDPNGDGDPADGIDGWRLDVADERPVEFWADWNKYVRKLNPQAYTSAEVWGDPAHLVLKGGFSACMNYYGFTIPVKGFLIDGKTKASAFMKTMAARLEALPKPVGYAMQNLMDSHDTDRLASMIVNRDRAQYGSEGPVEFNSRNSPRSSDYKIGKPDETDRAIQRLVVLLQMTWAGAPMIYYGDEVGMWGAHDPDDRMPMVWPDLKYAPQAIDPRGDERKPDDVAFNQELHDFYKRAAAIRSAHEAFTTGDFTPLVADDAAQTIAFTRSASGRKFVVALNRSEAEQTFETFARVGEPEVLFVSRGEKSGVGARVEGGKLKITLPPLTGAIIGPAEGPAAE